MDTQYNAMTVESSLSTKYRVLPVPRKLSSTTGVPACEMAQRIRALGAKPEDPSSIPGNRKVKGGENWLLPSCHLTSTHIYSRCVYHT